MGRNHRATRQDGGNVGVSPAQIDGAEISVVHGVGGMFAAAGTIILSNVAP
jgi:hypothetical protein